MPRYFIEVKYRGTFYKGFQTQLNASSIQGEINKAFSTIFKQKIDTVTSSRTDAGVHALQNYLHVDLPVSITHTNIYNLNAVLSKEIVITNIYQVSDNSHARFDAISREYDYFIIKNRNPFLSETSYFYPFEVDINKLNETASILIQTKDFSSFAKRHSDVNNFNCNIKLAQWSFNHQDQLSFKVVSNRFLRGMVRALVATQLLVGRGKISLDEFVQIINSRNCTQADFSAPAQGLFLTRVNYPDNILNPIMTIE